MRRGADGQTLAYGDTTAATTTASYGGCCSVMSTRTTLLRGGAGSAELHGKGRRGSDDDGRRRQGCVLAGGCVQRAESMAADAVEARNHGGAAREGRGGARRAK
jgi:hypothetical protein